jgi:prophage DNA circulation protein
MADTYLTSIAGFLLDAETISDSFSKSIAKHEFANTNGALLEDMGQKGRSITIRCYFGVDGGAASFADYFDFIDLLDNAEMLEFVHPEEGTLRGRIERMDKRKNDRQEFAEVDITFLESRIEVETSSEVSMPGFGEESFLDGQDEQQLEFADNLAEDLGADGISAAAKALDEAKSIISQFQAAAGKLRSYVAQVDSAVRTLEGTLVSITQPANAILATVNYGLDLPGRVIGSVARCVERYAETYKALRNFPAQFQRALKFELDHLEASFRAFQSKAPAGSARYVSETAAMTRIANHIRLSASHRLALEAAYGFANDRANRLAAKKNEDQKSFDLLGNYNSPVAIDPIMTVNEIESVLASVQTSAQASVDLMRGLKTVKRSAAGLVGFARIVALEASRIKTVDIDGVLPLHLILLQHGLPYNAADRVLSINPQIKHPNFVSGSIKIYAA